MITVAVGIIVNKDQRILVAQRMPHRAHPYTWEFPGGKVENGESDYAALCRELEEELGIIVSQIPEEPLYTCVYPFDETVELRFFVVKEFHGCPMLYDHLGLIWAHADDIQGLPLINASMVKALNAYKKTL